MTMKFSLRLIWLGGTAILLLISLFLWRNELLSLLFSPSEARVFTGIKSDRVQPDKSQKTVFDSSKRVFKVQNSSTCSYILKSRASTDINTHSVLHKIDEMYNATWKNPHYQNNVVDKLFGNPPYQSAVTVENRREKLEVVFVPHSHSDPGWLKTVDEYFHDQTRNTLNFMVEKLLKYPNMTFVWAESVFLSMWWKELTEDMKENVLKLVERNQFQVVVGSWVVPDEATSHYFAIIDQMIEGHQWLEQNLKIKPQTSWSLDPFGYSSTMAYLYRKAGFKQMVILRIHQYLKGYFQNNQKMEFYWRQHWDNTGNTDIFTTLLPFMLYGIKHQCGPDHYECLHFDFRHIAGEYSESMATDINDRNVAQMAKRLLVQVTKKNRMYKHNVVLVPVGDDFRYDRNIEWDQQYRNYQKLFNYMNGKKEWNVHARFGTLKDYYELINREQVKSGKISFPSLQGDFFPYSDKNEDYWTGYFTTRPYDKNLERQLETQLRSAEILNVLAKALSKAKERYMYYKSNIEKLEVARQSLGLFQHHDGITGTARAYVVQDYEERLNQGHLAVKSVIEKATAYLMAQRRDSTSFVNLKVNTLKSLHMVREKKVLDLNSADHKNRTIVLFNPSERQREDVIKIFVNYEYLEVYNQKNELILSQINPTWKQNNNLEISDTVFELVFLAKMTPLSLSKYTILAVPKHVKPKENLAAFVSFSWFKNPVILPEDTRFVSVAPRGETLILENSFLRARFSARSGYLQSVTTKAKLATKQVQSELLMYKSRHSGAYIFSPAGPAVDSEMFNKPPLMIIKGPVVSEIRVYQRENVCQHVVRVYNSTGLLGTALEINNFANMTEKGDKELILRFTTDVKNYNSSFYTDLNGLHSIKRKRFKNFPAEANYYPMTSFAYIEDEETRLSLLSAQSLGVSSQEDNSLEVMLHRRPLYDDGRGLGEGIYDAKVSPSQFFLLMEKPNYDNSAHFSNTFQKTGTDSQLQSFPSLHAHLLLDSLQHDTVVLLDESKETMLRPEFEALTGAFPCDVKLVNLRGMMPEQGISNQFAAAFILHKVGYDCSFPVIAFACSPQEQTDISPHTLFNDIKLKSVTETSLSLMFKQKVIEPGSFLVLNPMDLQTYKLVFETG